MRHIVALSGGKDSTAMALRLAEIEPRHYEYVYTPTKNELPEMRDHWQRLGELLGQPLIEISQVSLVGLIAKYRTLPNWRMRFCTRRIKIEPFMAYMVVAAPAVSYVGIRADEVGREGTDYKDAEGVTQDFPLVRWRWGLREVKSYLDSRGISIPERTDCALCFFQRLPEWWRLWKLYPQEFDRGVELEELTGHTLRSESRDSWPTALKDLRSRFEAGYVPAGANQLNMRLEISDRRSMCAVCAR